MQPKTFCLSLLVLVGAVFLADGYKIGIMVPDISGSQLLFNQRMGDVLAAAGHNVTIIRLQTLEYEKTKIKSPKKPGIDEWIVNGLVDGVDYNRIKTITSMSAFTDDSIWTMLSKEKREMMSAMMQTFVGGCEKMITDKEFIQRFEAAEFDVVYTTMYDFCSIGIQHLGKAKSWVWVNSGALWDSVANYVGLPVPPSYVAPMMMDIGDTLTFGQRLKSIIGHSITPIFASKFTADPQTAIFRKYYGANFPHLSDIARGAPLVFVNSNELYDLPRPTLHKIVNIGGLGMKKSTAKPLPKEYSDIVDKAKNVVVFSFGSVANSSQMPLEWKQGFMGAFAKFPETQFFLRYEGNDIQPPPNVHFRSWLPQVDLLQHPKTRAFITHGGFNSLQEAILAAQPIISIPLFGDQFRNARIAEKHGFGIILSKSDLKEEATITAALKNILTDKRYSEAVKTISRMVDHKPVPPETLLVKWTEFLAEFNTLDNLKPIGASLGAITYYNIDVYGTVIGVTLALLFIAFKFLAFIFRKVKCLIGFGKSTKRVNKNKKVN